MSKSGFRKVNTIWPGSSISEFRLSLFLFYIAYFSSFERVLFSSLGACFDPCFQVLHLPSSSRQLQFLSFRSRLQIESLRSFKTFHRRFFKTGYGEQNGSDQEAHKQILFILPGCYVPKSYLKISRKDRRRSFQGAFGWSSFRIGIYSRLILSRLHQKTICLFSLTIIFHECAWDMRWQMANEAGSSELAIIIPLLNICQNFLTLLNV